MFCYVPVVVVCFPFAPNFNRYRILAVRGDGGESEALGLGSCVGKAPVCVEETRNWNIGAGWSRVIGLEHSGSGKEP